MTIFTDATARQITDVREAAANYLNLHSEPKGFGNEVIRDGMFDEHPLIQAMHALLIKHIESHEVEIADLNTQLFTMHIGVTQQAKRIAKLDALVADFVITSDELLFSPAWSAYRNVEQFCRLNAVRELAKGQTS
jgi:hypothetical protein